MKKTHLFLLLSILFACNQSETREKHIDKSLHINMEDLYHEVMDVDSVLINGVLPVECTLSSAMNVFGDTLFTYYDHRFPYFDFTDSLKNAPLRIYVFEDAIFSLWKKDKLKLVKLQFNENTYFTYKGNRVGKGVYDLGIEFPNSYRISNIKERFRIGSGNAHTFFFNIRASNSNFYYSEAYWRFFINGEAVFSVELCSYRQ